MANPAHLEILKQGVEAWNTWLQNQPVIPIDFDLEGLDEGQEDALTKYFEVRISAAQADISGVDLNYHDLTGIDLSRVDLSGSFLRHVNLNQADLSRAKMDGADLEGARFTNANLSGAYLRRANLKGAKIFDSNFISARLEHACLTTAFINGADFTGAEMSGSDLMGATILSVTFGDNDLSGVKGLDEVRHLGRSILGLGTFYMSGGKIPDGFLRGCGVPENFITHLPSLTGRAIEFYSCFISYSSKDQDFAERLYADLQNKGVRCWFAPEDLRIGDRFRSRIDQSIRLHDKLLLVLSKHSVSSHWVEKEVETALEREAEQGETVLFPVRLDDAVNEIKIGWPADVRRTRHIGDFTQWKEHDSYQRAFERLLRDLKAGA